MADLKYKYNDTPLNDLIATDASSTILGTGVSSKSSDYGYSPEFTFVDKDKITAQAALPAWGDVILNLPFWYTKANGNIYQIPFVDPVSTPIVIAKTSGRHYLPYTGTIFATETVGWLKWDPEDGYCKYSANEGTTWANISKHHGVFLALQGGGGGGGDGSGVLGLFNILTNIGGGGGGGGGFVLVYLNLYNFLGNVVKFKVGRGGAPAHAEDTNLFAGTSGENGSPTYLYTDYNEFNTLIAANGGKGGGPGYWFSQAKGQGGDGGDIYIKPETDWDMPKYINICTRFNGKKGGNSGAISGWVSYIGLGVKHGQAGEGYTDSNWIDTKILANKQPIYRFGSPWSARYTSGAGQPCATYWAVTDWYTSGGGGGGASVCGQLDTTLHARDQAIGYGMGGYGASAETVVIHHSGTGTTGCLMILTSSDL